MASLAIPLTTLSPGAHSFGPLAVNSTDHNATITLDRTVGAFPLNTRSVSSTLEVLIEISTDGGLTFPYRIYGRTYGGIESDVETGQQNSFIINGSLPGEAKATHVRATITVTNENISASGSLVSS